MKRGMSMLLLWGLTWHSAQSAETDGPQSILSPDGQIKVTVSWPSPQDGASPGWSAAFHGKPLMKDCRLGLEFADSGDWLRGAKVVNCLRRSVNQRIPVLFGKAEFADDRFEESRFLLESTNGHRLEVVFRCYPDAIAFRYELPKQADLAAVSIVEETSAFGCEGAPTAYVQYLENYNTSHEHNVVATSFEGIRRETLLDTPLTLSWEDNTFAAITEAALSRYAGMSLVRRGGAPGLVCRLTPRADGTKVAATLPLVTPWRVVLVGKRPGALLESSTLYCLNEPCALPDVSWIKPGKITFHWWNGDVYDGRPGLPILSFEMAKKYIDFCARVGIPTHSLTSTEGLTTPWYQQSKQGVAPGPDTDVTKPRAGFDLEQIRQYADSKHIRLWTWVHQGALRGRVEEAFAAFEKMGWSGMMVDFIDHDDQDSVEFTESVLQAAARHHLLIHFHGVWKPTGRQRTYPNLMNHEGALNLEYLKWSDRCSPEHDLMMAFTRMVAGPMDYHLGGFRAVPRSAFKPQNIAPTVLGTRAHMLGLYVCYDNPNPMVADYPTAYEGQPGFDFLVRVPTWWDETKVLEDRIGELLVTARRKGNDWYVGGISARSPKDLELSLAFLDKHLYQAVVWKDGPKVDSDPNQLANEASMVSVNDSLKIHLALDGGFVVHLTRTQN